MLKNNKRFIEIKIMKIEKRIIKDMAIVKIEIIIKIRIYHNKISIEDIKEKEDHKIQIKREVNLIVIDIKEEDLNLVRINNI